MAVFNLFLFISVPTEWREYMSGWGAAMFNIFVTFPVNKTVFRQQVYGFSMQDALIQLKAEGHSIYIRTVALKTKQNCIL